MRATWVVFAILLGAVPCLAVDPTVVQAEPIKNIGNTLHLKATSITPAAGQTIQSAQAVWRKKGDTNWIVGCFLGNSPGPYESNTINTFVTGDKIETAIMVIVVEGGTPRQTGALANRDYTVP
jgi:hypothetical protein